MTCNCSVMYNVCNKTKRKKKKKVEIYFHRITIIICIMRGRSTFQKLPPSLITQIRRNDELIFSRLFAAALRSRSIFTPKARSIEHDFNSDGTLY